MENETQNVNPAPMPPLGTEPARKPIGAFVGSLIIIIVLTLGGLYLWYANIQPRIDQKDTALIPPITETAADTVTTQLTVQNTSDESSAIEQDLNTIDMNGLNKELQAL